MAIELVTGHAGEAHISGADVGALVAGVIGTGTYALGSAPSVTMTDANTLSIGPGDLVMQGRHVRLTGTQTLSIRSGSQTGMRADLVVARYSVDADTNVESVSLAVVEGTTGDAAEDPALPNPASVLDGATVADAALVRVTLDGLAPSAEWLPPVLPTSSEVRDVAHGGTGATSPAGALSSLGAHITGLWSGSKVVNPGTAANYFYALSASDIDKICGSVNHATGHIAVLCQNGDWSAMSAHFVTTMHGGSVLVALFDNTGDAVAANKNLRVNYLIVTY